MPKNALPPVAAPLLIWYKKNARILPWREHPSPYRTLVSEFMLQQTRVEAAIPYFNRFVLALPDIPSLAGADEQTLLKLWEGLGYYSRARNLQKAARMVMEDFGGRVPASFADLLRLPGVGPYTAGAIASIAFGIPVPAVDGNVLRVVSRIKASKKDIGDASVRRAMEKEIREIIPDGRAGDFNQALMELGATVCLPGEPICGRCPLAADCRGRIGGVAASLPVRRKKPDKKIQEKTVFLLSCGGRLAILRRPDGGLLGGLWGLPSAEGFLSPMEARKELLGWGFHPPAVESLPPAKHVFTHIEWHMKGIWVQIDSIPSTNPFTWASAAELRESYPLPSAYRFYLKYFSDRL